MCGVPLAFNPLAVLTATSHLVMASQWKYSWPAASAPSSSSHPGSSYLPSWSVPQSQQEVYLSSNRMEPLQHQLREEATSRVNPPRPPQMAHQFPPQPPGQFYNYHGGGTNHMPTGPRPPPPAPPAQPPVWAPLGQGDATQYAQPRYSQLLPSTFQSDDIFLDKTEVRGLQLYRHVQPTQWSRRVGLAGTAILDLPLTRLLRGALSNGRYSTPVMAQTIAEAVLLTSILKALRGREVDIDRTARSLHADNAPDKRNEAMQFMEPLALKIVDLMESLQPAKQENLTRHKIAELEQQLERYKNKGITLTPDKKLPSSSPSNATPGRSDQSLYINAANSDQQGPPLPVPSPEADPAPKRRPAKRKTPAAAPDITLDSELLRQGNPKGQQVPLPTSLTDKVFKAWLHERTLSNQATYLDLIKQELASDTVEQLKTIAVKWGATISLVSKGSKRALLQFITVMYMYGK